jgi:hypothetical protein
VLGLGGNVISQLLLLRLARFRLLPSLFAGFFLGFFVILFLELFNYLPPNGLIFSEFIYTLLTNFIIYGLLGYCYFHFINLGETGRRIRIMLELHQAGNGLTLEEILQRYSAQDVIDNRLKRLLNNKQILQKDNRYFVNRSLILYITKLMVMAKLFIIGKKSAGR